jgi:hypothetical protein
MSIKLSREAIKKLTAGERAEYDRQMSNARTRKYREANKHTQEYKDKNKNYTKKYRAEHREKYLILNRKHNKTYRAKQKAIKNSHITNRKGEKLDVKELLAVRKELKR